MRKKLLSILLILILIAGSILGASFYIAATRWRSAGDVAVDVRPGMSVRAIANELAEKGAIGTPMLFEIYVRAKGLGSKLKAGTYDIPAGTNMVGAVGKLASGDVRQYEFTIIEGWTIEDIAKALEDKSYIESENTPNEFRRLARDKEFMKGLGLEGSSSLEGYLFPDTYRVNYPLKARDFLVRLTKRFDEVWNSIAQSEADLAGRKKEDVVTLASIVEKETGVDSERPVIAGIFVNRLKNGVALQSDPTIIYGLPNFDGNIRKSDISNPHPYNTYIHPGLPPGPISNSGKASLVAALKPEQSEYMYFVSKNDGTHEFSKTLSEHLKAVRRYQIVGEGRKK